MSRWGGFKKGRNKYVSKWDQLKSNSAQRVVTTANVAQEFSYAESQGIWNLRSTVQFPKSNANGGMTLTFIGSATGATSATIPAQAAAGDLAIFYSSRHDNNIAGSYSMPTGFTQVQQNVDTFDSAMISGYKVLTISDIGSSVSGIASGTNINNIGILIFRPSQAINSISPFSVQGQATIGNPASQNINILTAPSYRGLLAVAFMSGTDTLVPDVPVSMTEISISSTSSAFYQLFNGSQIPDLTVDMLDEGDNVMQSWALAIN